MDQPSPQEKIKVAWEVFCDAVLEAAEAEDGQFWPAKIIEVLDFDGGENPYNNTHIVKGALFALRRRKCPGARLSYQPNGGLWRLDT